MITKEQVAQSLKEVLPKGFRVGKIVDYDGIYILQIFNDNDPLEGDMDPFYSVDPNTGAIEDFYIFDDLDRIAELFGDI